MTATANPAQGTWPVGTVPFATKYGVLNNLSTSSPRGTVFDPYTSPDALFINNEQGVWYDPSDFSTMWQDAAATTPVTAVEQPVGKILDKSGRGNHATQATSASRPILRQDANGKYYLFFDGIDDSLATAAINFTSTDKMTVFAGIRKLSDAALGMVVELSADVNTNNGSFYLLAPRSNGTASTAFLSKGTVGANANADLFAAPVTGVLTCTSTITPALALHRRNGGQVAINAAAQGTGNYGNYPLFVGRRGGASMPFNGHLYSLIVRGAQSTDAQIAAAESFVNSRTGAY